MNVEASAAPEAQTKTKKTDITKEWRFFFFFWLVLAFFGAPTFHRDTSGRIKPKYASLYNAQFFDKNHLIASINWIRLCIVLSLWILYYITRWNIIIMPVYINCHAVILNWPFRILILIDFNENYYRISIFNTSWKCWKNLPDNRI